MVVTMGLYFAAKTYPMLILVRLLNGIFYGITPCVQSLSQVPYFLKIRWEAESACSEWVWRFPSLSLP